MQATGSAASSNCPICEHPFSEGARTKKLYKGHVCANCHQSFLARRCLAFLIDGAVIRLLSHGIMWIYLPAVGALPWGIHAGHSVQKFLPLLLFTPLFLIKDAYRGYSPGKAMMGLRVLDSNTCNPIGPWQSFKRNLPMIIPLAQIYALFQTIDEGGVRIGDRWANTQVVWRKHAHKSLFDTRQGVCRHCGYDLRSNVSGRCPECGKAIPTEA